MRKVLLIIGLLIGFIGYGQTYVEYISEPTDSMALISKYDVDIINNVFKERNILDSLHNINEQIISTLELTNKTQFSVLQNQIEIIKNKDQIIKELEAQNRNDIEYYNKELKNEKNKKLSFQTTTLGLIVIIILILI